MPRPTRLRLESLEARETPSANRLFAISQDAGNKVFVYEATGFPAQFFQPSRDFRTGLNVPIYSGSGRLVASFSPYSAGYTGGVRLAIGDVTGDGVEDLVTAPGEGGGPHIKVFDGAQLLNGRAVMVREFSAFDPDFRGGVYVAVGRVEPMASGGSIIVSAGTGGGPHVRVFAANSSSPIRDFFAFDAGFRGGARVAAADINGDGRADVIVGAGPGADPEVRVFDLTTTRPNQLNRFYAYDRSFRGGVYVAAGELNGIADRAEIVTGAGEGGGPHVKVWGRSTGTTMSLQHEFFAGDSSSRAGVRVSLGNLNKLADRQSIYTSDGDVPRGQTPNFSTADPRLRSFNLTQFITMLAAGYSTPPADSMYSFTETYIDLFDGFLGMRVGGLNIG